MGRCGPKSSGRAASATRATGLLTAEVDERRAGSTSGDQPSSPQSSGSHGKGASTDDSTRAIGGSRPAWREGPRPNPDAAQLAADLERDQQRLPEHQRPLAPHFGTETLDATRLADLPAQPRPEKPYGPRKPRPEMARLQGHKPTDRSCPKTTLPAIKLATAEGGARVRGHRPTHLPKNRTPRQTVVARPLDVQRRERLLALCCMLVLLAEVIGLEVAGSWFEDYHRQGRQTIPQGHLRSALGRFLAVGGAAATYMARRHTRTTRNAAYGLEVTMDRYGGFPVIAIRLRFRTIDNAAVHLPLVAVERMDFHWTAQADHEELEPRCELLIGLVMDYFEAVGCPLVAKNLVTVAVRASDHAYALYRHRGTTLTSPRSLGEIERYLPARMPNYRRVAVAEAAVYFAESLLSDIDQLAMELPLLRGRLELLGYLQDGDRDYDWASPQGLISFARRMAFLEDNFLHVRTIVLDYCHPHVRVTPHNRHLQNRLRGTWVLPSTLPLVSLVRVAFDLPARLARELLDATTAPQVLRAILGVLDSYHSMRVLELTSTSLIRESWPDVLYDGRQELFPRLRRLPSWSQYDQGPHGLPDISSRYAVVIINLHVLQEFYRETLEHYMTFLAHPLTRALQIFFVPLRESRSRLYRNLCKEMCVGPREVLQERATALETPAYAQRPLLELLNDPTFVSICPRIETLAEQLYLLAPPMRGRVAEAPGVPVPLYSRARSLLDWMSVEQLVDPEIGQLSEAWMAARAGASAEGQQVVPGVPGLVLRASAQSADSDGGLSDAPPPSQAAMPTLWYAALDEAVAAGELDELSEDEEEPPIDWDFMLPPELATDIVRPGEGDTSSQTGTGSPPGAGEGDGVRTGTPADDSGELVPSTGAEPQPLASADVVGTPPADASAVTAPPIVVSVVAAPCVPAESVVGPPAEAAAAPPSNAGEDLTALDLSCSSETQNDDDNEDGDGTPMGPNDDAKTEETACKTETTAPKGEPKSPKASGSGSRKSRKRAGSPLPQGKRTHSYYGRELRPAPVFVHNPDDPDGVKARSAAADPTAASTGKGIYTYGRGKLQSTNFVFTADDKTEPAAPETKEEPAGAAPPSSSSADETSPAPPAPAVTGPPVIWHDVFPGAVPAHLLRCDDGIVARAQRDIRDRQRLLAGTTAYTAPNDKTRTLVLRPYGGPRSNARARLIAANRRIVRRDEDEAAGYNALQLLAASLDPYPEVTGQTAPMLSDVEIARSMAQWRVEFAGTRADNVHLVDPVILQLSEGWPTASWEAMDLPGLVTPRYQIVPLWIDPRNAAQRASALAQYNADERVRALQAGECRINQGNVRQAMRAGVGHWTLVIADHERNNLYFLDSLHAPHGRGRLFAWLAQDGNPLGLMNVLDWQPAGLPQGDGASCGRRILAWTRYFLLHLCAKGKVPETQMRAFPKSYP